MNGRTSKLINKVSDTNEERKALKKAYHYQPAGSKKAFKESLLLMLEVGK